MSRAFWRASSRTKVAASITMGRGFLDEQAREAGALAFAAGQDAVPIAARGGCDTGSAAMRQAHRARAAMPAGRRHPSRVKCQA
ncbi:hypothetical protein [Bosea sp. (in: a-proteobacteria)]|uniref:hypothetical protein n=1 Tax=Bosea sp. (in: a-proteobacteria) TaxID=1871050 RepID=UPI0025BA7C17|nr:hypothetical protein [Bosea sp. (in: a-proteobacteria)]